MPISKKRGQIEFFLDEIDRWQSGDKATPGLPANGQQYPLVMREEIKRLEKYLSALRNPKQEGRDDETEIQHGTIGSAR